MKVAIFHGAGQPITIEQAEMPRPGPDDVLIQVKRCGICGSDLSMTGEAPYNYAPGLIGHEYAGVVAQVGRNVTGLAVGQKVAALPGTPCGQCEGCRRTGSAVFCHNPRRAAHGVAGFAGSGGFGGFGEFVAIPAGGAIGLPQSLSFADGALVEPMACGLHALRMAGMARGAVVLVLGAGSMALSMIYWARALGAGRIIVASRSAHRREVAMAMGADGFHSFGGDDPDQLAGLLGTMPDIVAECVGKPGMLASAIEQVAPQGTVISLGMCQHSEPITASLGNFKEVRLLFPVAYSVAEFVETARAFDAGKVHPEMMVSEVIGLEALPDTIEAMRGGTLQSLKILVDPQLG